jgi:hypothetical protein
MSEHDWEPVRGLPGLLPPGEEMLWQGAPDWRVLFRSAFHGRLVALYFGVLAAAGLIAGSWLGAAITAGAGLLCLALLAGWAWAASRTTVYTLTTRRVVLRVGIALPKCFNLPLKLVESADLRAQGGGFGDLALTMGGSGRIAYLFLWPHARPWRLRNPQPMLRAVPQAEAVAARLARACAAVATIERTPAAEPSRMPVALPVGVAA